MQSLPSTSVEMLDKMSYADLEIYKTELETLRQRILHLQNSQSFLLRLPGELRNRIYILAMHAEIDIRRQQGRHRPIFAEPAFFNLNRQIKTECSGLWFSEFLVWEEFCGAECGWRGLRMEEVKEICGAKSIVGQATLVTQPAFCGLGRMREGVEESRSICPRKGLVRVRRGGGMGGLKWWVW